jgi:GT2 family glycosyltransferase
MTNPDIAIIINSFNRLQLLKNCLNALSWIPESDFSTRCAIVIYDAGSADGTLEWLAEQRGTLGIPVEVIIPAKGDDTSFSAGLNAGVEAAIKKHFSLKYLLFYETDNQILNSKPLQDALEQIENRKRLAACGFTVLRHDGTSAGVGQPFPALLNFALGKNIVHRFQLEAIPYKWETNISGIEFTNVDVVYTSPLLVRVDAWKESGGLDAKLFPFSDCDVDWARRLRDLGWRMGVIQTNAVIHDNLEAISAWSKSRALQNHRGRLRYFRRHRPMTIVIVWPLFLLIRHFLELTFTKIAVKEPDRKLYLSNQFYGLLKSCYKKYE